MHLQQLRTFANALLWRDLSSKNLWFQMLGAPYRPSAILGCMADGTQILSQIVQGNACVGQQLLDKTKKGAF